MFTAALVAVAVLAPAGTATIQADPVCLPAVAQPGHSYGFTVSASGGNLAVVPDRLDAAPLRQVPSSWVRFGSSSAILAVPQDAAPGPYQSLIEVAAPGGPGRVSLGAAATTAFVFTVSPSKVPPPPCDALDLAQSTGKFPPWPTRAFATSSWKQVFAREQASEPRPLLSPTAGTGAQPAPAGQYAPVSPAASQGSARGVPKVIWWVLLVALSLCALRIFRRRKS